MTKILTETRATMTQSAITSDGSRACTVCRARIARGTTPIACAGCAAVAHRSCSGLPRQSTGVDWRCRSCLPNAANPTTDEPGPSRNTKNAKCPACARPLTHCRLPLICCSCNRRFHLKCAPETRGALEVRRRNNTWSCPTCRLPHPPPPSSPNARKNALPPLRKHQLMLL